MEEGCRLRLNKCRGKSKFISHSLSLSYSLSFSFFPHINRIFIEPLLHHQSFRFLYSCLNFPSSSQIHTRTAVALYEDIRYVSLYLSNKVWHSSQCNGEFLLNVTDFCGDWVTSQKFIFFPLKRLFTRFSID